MIKEKNEENRIPSFYEVIQPKINYTPIKNVITNNSFYINNNSYKNSGINFEKIEKNELFNSFNLKLNKIDIETRFTTPSKVRDSTPKFKNKKNITKDIVNFNPYLESNLTPKIKSKKQISSYLMKSADNIKVKNINKNNLTEYNIINPFSLSSFKKSKQNEIVKLRNERDNNINNLYIRKKNEKKGGKIFLRYKSPLVLRKKEMKSKNLEIIKLIKLQKYIKSFLFYKKVKNFNERLNSLVKNRKKEVFTILTKTNKKRRKILNKFIYKKKNIRASIFNKKKNDKLLKLIKQNEEKCLKIYFRKLQDNILIIKTLEKVVEKPKIKYYFKPKEKIKNSLNKSFDLSTPRIKIKYKFVINENKKNNKENFNSTERLSRNNKGLSNKKKRNLSAIHKNYVKNRHCLKLMILIEKINNIKLLKNYFKNWK